MSVRQDVSQLTPQALIEMYIFDPTVIGQPSTAILRWHPGTQGDRDPIVWQGVTYQPFPIEATGFEATGAGKLPRPSMRAANIGGSIGAYLRAMDDGLGAKITRKRTFGKYLDAVNFPGGNPTANSAAHFDDEVFYLARKASEGPIFIEFELAVRFDVRGIKLPRRQVIAGTCMWKYRGPECSYTGPAITNDPVFPDPAAHWPDHPDKCGKTLTSCKLRFPKVQGLPTSAFPGSQLARYSA